ncbi:class II aldolase/adducin family protein [Muricoccus radiodurans]|uniref:class II aldolase/adducin family protein n=1 Tax=Muricoccus radiodurans TaxID=2231721 RepID=UPI003CED002E
MMAEPKGPGHNLDPQQARIDLAAALRWVARLGFHEGVCNHFSVMLAPDRFLINAHQTHWSKARASDLLVIDDRGRVLEGEGQPAMTGFNIHVPMHLQTGHRVIMHTHMPYATAITCIEGGRLEMVHQNAGRFYGLCAYDEDFNGFALGTDEGSRMARMMGHHRVLFLGNHGVVVAGDSVADALDDLYYLERACEIQVLAMSTGRPLRHIPEEKALALRDFPTRRDNARMLLAAVRGILDEEEPAYAS